MESVIYATRPLYLMYVSYGYAICVPIKAHPGRAVGMLHPYGATGHGCFLEVRNLQKGRLLLPRVPDEGLGHGPQKRSSSQKQRIKHFAIAPKNEVCVSNPGVRVPPDDGGNTVTVTEDIAFACKPSTVYVVLHRLVTQA
jgi:hypothetical protein